MQTKTICGIPHHPSNQLNTRYSNGKFVSGCQMVVVYFNQLWASESWSKHFFDCFRPFSTFFSDSSFEIKKKRSGFRMAVWKWDWKSLFMVQNVQCSNGPPSHVILPFEYRTSILFRCSILRWLLYTILWRWLRTLKLNLHRVAWFWHSAFCPILGNTKLAFKWITLQQLIQQLLSLVVGEVPVPGFGNLSPELVAWNWLVQVPIRFYLVLDSGRLRWRIVELKEQQMLKLGKFKYSWHSVIGLLVTGNIQLLDFY